MAEDLNNVFLVGRLTRDMDLSHTAGGYPIGKLSVAVNRRRKSGEQWEDEANFFDLTLWGKRAEALQRYLVKGTQVAVQGQLKQDRWEQDGQKRSRVVIELNNIQLVGGRGAGGEHYGSGGPASAYSAAPSSYAPAPSGTGFKPAPSAPNNAPPSIPVEGDFEDDIPF